MSPNSILEINKGTIILSLEFLTKIPKIKPLKEIIDGLFEDYKEAYLALEKEV